MQAERTFVRGAINGTLDNTRLNEKVVHWKRNMIKVPSGKAESFS